jgi:transcriptional regulator with XRE-family HTH domain
VITPRNGGCGGCYASRKGEHQQGQTGKIITELRDKKGWSQADLADKSGVSRVMVGKYERGEAVPSIDAAKKIADALETSLDYLTGDTKTPAFDKKTLQRLEDLQQLDEPKRQTLFDLMDTYIWDAKARRAYAS